MSNPRKPFRINVGFIINQEFGYSHEFPFDFEKIQVSDELALREFTGLASIGRTPQGLLVQGKFSGQTSLQCGRCLQDYEHSLYWDLTELYAFNSKSVTDSGLIVPDDAQIDLAPLVREYALLEIPISPVCKPNCRGLCPECGQNLNEQDCGHRPAENMSPFTVLKKLLK
jgi:uncharacterized protein